MYLDQAINRIGPHGYRFEFWNYPINESEKDKFKNIGFYAKD